MTSLTRLQPSGWTGYTGRGCIGARLDRKYCDNGVFTPLIELPGCGLRPPQSKARSGRPKPAGSPARGTSCSCSDTQRWTAERARPTGPARAVCSCSDTQRWTAERAHPTGPARAACSCSDGQYVRYPQLCSPDRDQPSLARHLAAKVSRADGKLAPIKTQYYRRGSMHRRRPPRAAHRSRLSEAVQPRTESLFTLGHAPRRTFTGEKPARQNSPAPFPVGRGQAASSRASFSKANLPILAE